MRERERQHTTNVDTQFDEQPDGICLSFVYLPFALLQSHTHKHTWARRLVLWVAGSGDIPFFFLLLLVAFLLLRLTSHFTFSSFVSGWVWNDWAL